MVPGPCIWQKGRSIIRRTMDGVGRSLRQTQPKYCPSPGYGSRCRYSGFHARVLLVMLLWQMAHSMISPGSILRGALQIRHSSIWHCPPAVPNSDHSRSPTPDTPERLKTALGLAHAVLFAGPPRLHRRSPLSLLRAASRKGPEGKRFSAEEAPISAAQPAAQACGASVLHHSEFDLVLPGIFFSLSPERHLAPAPAKDPDGAAGTAPSRNSRMLICSAPTPCRETSVPAPFPGPRSPRTG
jgi:hypothetical protein